MMCVGVMRKKRAGREGGVVGRIGVEPRLQADCVVLRVRPTHSPHRCEGRLLAHPVGRVHDQRALRRGHFHPSSTLLLLQHRHTTQTLRIALLRVVAQAEGVINAGAPTAVHLVDGGRERVQCGEVHQGVIHGVGSFIGDLVMIAGLISYHVLSVQEEVGVHLQLLGVILVLRSNVIVHLALAIPGEVPVGMVCHVHDGRLLVAARLKQHVQLVCCGEGVSGLDMQSSRVPLLHVRRLARKDYGDAVGLLFDASLPQALIVKEKGKKQPCRIPSLLHDCGCFHCWLPGCSGRSLKRTRRA